MRTNNYSNILRQIYSLNDSAPLDITNTAGQTADLPDNVVFKSDYTSVATDVANTTGFCVTIGSSNTEPTSNDTNLNSVLTSGFTSLITGPFYDFGSASITSVLKIAITAGNSDITVGEFGWYYNGCLLDHTVLPSPVTITANTMKTFGYAMFNGLYDQHKLMMPAEIGRPGSSGFGVGVFRGNSTDLDEMQLTPMEGCDDVTSDNYGNYIHANGSVMCFIPAFCYRIGQPTAPSYERDGSNALEIGPANLDGTDNWILHRAFIDGGQKKSGFFIDKYINSKSRDGLTAVSVKNGNPIELTYSELYNRSSTMTDGTGKLRDAITFGRNRGEQYSCMTNFQWSAIGMLSLAHAQASTSTEFCAWYDPTNNTNFPKGNNDRTGAKKDVDDPSITFTASDATSEEAKYYTKAGSGVPFAKTTHNGQNCGISDVNGNKKQACIGYASFTKGPNSESCTNYVLKESIKVHDITGTSVYDTSNYDKTSTYSICGDISYWGADAFYTESSGPNRALCGVVPKTQSSQSSAKLKIFGDDSSFNENRDYYASLVGGNYQNTTHAGIFYRYDDSWIQASRSGCRCAGYPADSASGIGKPSQNRLGVGIPGTRGFGVGVYPGTNDELEAAGLVPMRGYNNPKSDNYGNYQHANGSVMCFVPAFCYRIGKSTAPSYARDGSNALEIGPAELDGTDNWILHRAFIDGGQKKSGFFIDKYINSKSEDGLTAVSVKNGNPISLIDNASFSGYNTSQTMTGGTGKLRDAITFGRNRGEQYSCITSFQWSAIAMLQLAHAQASTSTEFCAWYDSANTTNFPKGNNNRKKDVDDSSITFTASNVTSLESKDGFTKAGSGIPFAKTTHNGQNCGISDVNGNKFQPCIGYCSFTSGTNYVLKESIKAHDITVDNVSTTSNYDRASSYSGSSAIAKRWGADAFYTDASGPNRAMCGVMAKTQTTTSLSIFGEDDCRFDDDSNFAHLVSSANYNGRDAGIFSRDHTRWTSGGADKGCRCAGYLK